MKRRGCRAGGAGNHRPVDSAGDKGLCVGGHHFRGADSQRWHERPNHRARGAEIRAIEAATGIDLIIDETPEAVVISGFDPLRREVAKVSLERLMQDGRIHPTRIEEIVEKVKTDLDKLMVEEAEKIIFELGLSISTPT